MDDTNCPDEAMNAIKEELLKDLVDSIPTRPSINDPQSDLPDIHT